MSRTFRELAGYISSLHQSCTFPVRWSSVILARKELLTIVLVQCMCQQCHSIAGMYQQFPSPGSLPWLDTAQHPKQEIAGSALILQTLTNLVVVGDNLCFMFTYSQLSACNSCARLTVFSPALRLRNTAITVDCSATTSQPAEASRRDLLASSLLIATASSIPAPSLAAARSAQDLVPLVQHDFQESQYYITGRLTKDIFASDCVFKDPTTNVKGPEKYSKAVAALFDPNSSRADLISIKVSTCQAALVNQACNWSGPYIFEQELTLLSLYQAIGSDTIELKWRFEATLNFPTSPKIKPYTGTTIYHITDGLIDKHTESWDISALDAFISVFLPNFGATAAPPVGKS